MSKTEEKTARTTMFEFQEAQIESLRNLVIEYYVEITDLKSSNGELKKIIIDLLDEDCKDSYREAVKKFIFQDAD